MDIVKKIMIAKDTLNYKLSAKTGWSSQNNKEIGWYVGYLETSDNVYFFSNCIQTENEDNEDFAKARKEIVFSIFKDLKLIEN